MVRQILDVAKPFHDRGLLIQANGAPCGDCIFKAVQQEKKIKLAAGGITEYDY
jgi:hypothetical protein